MKSRNFKLKPTSQIQFKCSEKFKSIGKMSDSKSGSENQCFLKGNAKFGIWTDINALTLTGQK